MSQKTLFPWLALASLLIVTATLFNCGGGGGGGDTTTPPPTNQPSAAEKMLTAQGQVMQNAVDAFVARADELRVSADDLAASPTAAGLETVRERHLQTALAWQRLESCHFGPAKEQRLERQIHFWPTRPGTIDQTLADWATVSQQDFAELGVAGKGFPAMEYLLHGPHGRDLTAADQADARAYLAAMAADIKRVADQLATIWAEDGEAFYTQWVDAFKGTTLYPSFHAALSAMVNQLAFQLEQVKNTKIGKPYGQESGGAPRPETVEAPYGHFSAAYVQANLEMVQWLYLGDNGSGTGFGLHEYLAERDQALADEIVASLTRSMATIAALRQANDDLAVAVSQNPDEVAACIDELQTLIVLIKVDLANVLGVTITFNDNDGD